MAVQRRESRRHGTVVRRGGPLLGGSGLLRAYGKDLVTGAPPLEPTEYRALNPPAGKAVIKAAEYLRPHEFPSPHYPFALITGRTLYQFHTRTKTGRAPELQAAAPDVWVELSPADARRCGVAEGDVVTVSTPRGSVTAAARVSGIRDGVLFLPFHYGYWDSDDADGHHRAANELTLTDWDPVSKQPIFKKTAAAQLRRVRAGNGQAPCTDHGGCGTRRSGWEGMMAKIGLALRELHRSELRLTRSLEAIAARHHNDHAICHVATDLAQWSREHVALVSETGDRYGVRLRAHPRTAAVTESAQRWISDRLGRRPEPALLLLADLRRLHRLAAGGVSLDWELLAQGGRRRSKIRIFSRSRSAATPQALRQMRWANAMLKELSPPQALAS